MLGLSSESPKDDQMSMRLSFPLRKNSYLILFLWQDPDTSNWRTKVIFSWWPLARDFCQLHVNFFVPEENLSDEIFPLSFAIGLLFDNFMQVCFTLTPPPFLVISPRFYTCAWDILPHSPTHFHQDLLLPPKLQPTLLPVAMLLRNQELWCASPKL